MKYNRRPIINLNPYFSIVIAEDTGEIGVKDNRTNLCKQSCVDVCICEC